MTDDERRSILTQLEEGRAMVSAELGGITDEEASHRPATGWSIQDCVEHMAVAEALLLHLIAHESFPCELTAGREDAYLRGIQNRKRKFPAPEGMHPAERFPSLAAGLRAFADARAKTVRYIETIGEDLRQRKTIHPVAGEITCRECLALLIGHPLRHLEQIREIRAAVGSAQN